MTLDQAFEFRVDEQYENEKGLFTVLSIKDGMMEIQWEDGETIQTEVDLQRSIQLRRLMEQRLAEAEALAKQRKASKAAGAGGRRFDGLQATDFKDSAARTRWRGRDQLGGAVSQKLPRDTHSFLSWALAQCPEVHWQDAAHRKRDTSGHAAVFFVKVDTQSLTCGFKVSRVAGDDADAKDWHAAAGWLQQSDNAEQLHAIAVEDGLNLILHTNAIQHRMEAVEGGWQAPEASSVTAVTEPGVLMAAVAATGPTVFEVSRSMPKDDALALAGDLAVEIAEVFKRLMAIYRGVIA